MPEALRLRGNLDWQALERTLQTIVQRHESLRTHFGDVDGEPVQVIVPELRIDVPVEDLSGLDEDAQQAAIAAAVRRESDEPFDLSRGPLLRMKLLKLGDQEHVLLRTCHHIVSDGWSLGVFNREFAELYAAFRAGRENPLAPLPVQYADFTLWQRACLEGETLQRGLDYWKKQLVGIPERLELPTDRPRPAFQTYAADDCQVTLPAEQVAKLQRLSRECQATTYMTLLSAFAALLQRYTGQDDIVVGSPIANRQEPQLEQLIGFFVNSLVMRLRIQPEASFRTLIAEVRRTTLDAYQHQDIPFERLVEVLSPKRSLSHSPVFQVVFALQNASMGETRLDPISYRRSSWRDSWSSQSPRSLRSASTWRSTLTSATAGSSFSGSTIAICLTDGGWSRWPATTSSCWKGWSRRRTCRCTGSTSSTSRTSTAGRVQRHGAADPGDDAAEACLSHTWRGLPRLWPLCLKISS